MFFDFEQFINLRVAVLGNVDVGKSTLLGVLTQGELDNGRGRARLNLFRHLHEIQSGRTSSISHETLGFNSKGEVGYKSCFFLSHIPTAQQIPCIENGAHNLRTKEHGALEIKFACRGKIDLTKLLVRECGAHKTDRR